MSSSSFFFRQTTFIYSCDLLYMSKSRKVVCYCRQHENEKRVKRDQEPKWSDFLVERKRSSLVVIEIREKGYCLFSLALFQYLVVLFATMLQSCIFHKTFPYCVVVVYRSSHVSLFCFQFEPLNSFNSASIRIKRQVTSFSPTNPW